MMAASSAMARYALGSHGLMSLTWTNAAFAPSSAPQVLFSRCSSKAGDQKQGITVVSKPSRLEIPSADSRNETRLISVAPLLSLTALPGAGAITELFQPFGELAVVLFAMGGYGSYLGWQIRLSPDGTAKAAAKDLHPKLLAGMFFFFVAGATGGVISLVTSGKPIFEITHAVTGLLGMFLLGIQTALFSAFEVCLQNVLAQECTTLVGGLVYSFVLREICQLFLIVDSFSQANPDLRNVHAIFGTSIMALFFVHAVFGLQLDLSY